MKKYYQAALALTAALSLVAVFFYRNEYNRLRFVLQVFNYFGTAIQKNNNTYTCSSIVDDRLSSWQRLTDNIYIYSAYNLEDGKITAIALAQQENKEEEEKMDFKCQILFSDELEPVSGQFSHKLIDVDNKNALNKENFSPKKQFAFLFDCKYDKGMNNKTVVGVQFLPAAESTKNALNYFPIIQVFNYKNDDGDLVKGGNVVCVLPPTPSKIIKYIDMITFLAFHDYLNWDNFIVYDYGISPVFNSAIKSMSLTTTEKWNFTYTTLSWNFPYHGASPDLIKRLIETDCLYRNYNRASLVVALAWNEFINLKYHTSVENVIVDIGKVTGKLVDKYRASVQLFCTNQSDEDLFSFDNTPLVLRKTRILENINYNQSRDVFKADSSGLIKSLDGSRSGRQQNVDDLILISRYQRCNAYDNVADKNAKIKAGGEGVLRFAEYVTSTGIFQYYVGGKLFNQ